MRKKAKKQRQKKEFCPVCGKGEFRRDLASFDPVCESDGRNEACKYCETIFWIPANPDEPLIGVADADELLFGLPDDESFKVFGTAEDFIVFATKFATKQERGGEENEILVM